MGIEKYLAFYLPTIGKNREVTALADDPGQLPAGAILVIQINKDGTRQIYSQKENRTTKEHTFHSFGMRALEFKHDGGDTPEMRQYLRDNR